MNMTANELRQDAIPRCASLDGTGLKIVPAYTEAGRFTEANCVTITDGERTAEYVPAVVLTNAEPP